MVNCKCQNCENRTQRCHADCPDYAEYVKERSRFNEHMKKERQSLGAQTRTSLSPALAFKKIKGGRMT